MGKAIIGFLAVFLIFITVVAGQPMVEFWGMLFQTGIVLFVIALILYIAICGFHLIGRIICWIFKGFRDF